MKVEVREVESGRLVQSFLNVNEVVEGACGMLLFQTNEKNILYPSCLNWYIEIYKKEGE